jgi:FKBP-type peptidyl-prolyl cis-trans isomerase SlyD
MKVGEEKRILIHAGDTFGDRNDGKVSVYPLKRKIYRTLQISTEKYKELHNDLPKLGETVHLFSHIDGVVVERNEKNLVFQVIPPEQQKIVEEYGITRIVVDKEAVYFSLEPDIGSTFKKDGETGTITDTDENNFTVDYNHPLAGKEITVDIKVVSLKKKSKILEKSIKWMDSFEDGAMASNQTGKNFVLLLYREDCGWCGKMMTETFESPIIQELSGDFIWSRIDSTENYEYMEAFEQDEFPTIIVFDKNQNEVKRIEGYHSPFDLRLALESISSFTSSETRRGSGR